MSVHDEIFHDESLSVGPSSDRPRRDRKLTEKGRDFRLDICAKNLDQSYCKWKNCVKEIRTKLKYEITSTEQERLLTSLNDVYNSFLSCYDDLKSLKTPTRSDVRKADCVTQITQDVHEVATKNQCAPYNKEIARLNVRTILSKEVNPSVFGESDTEVLDSIDSFTECHDIRSCRSSSHLSQRSEAIAELAEKKAEVEALHHIQTQQRRLKEEEQKLDMVKALEKVKIAEAKVKALENETGSISHFSNDNSASKTTVGLQNDATNDVFTLLRESVHMNRLPAPEPPIFSGDPLQFSEWISSFRILIERRCSSQAEKLFYLKRYTSGVAANVIRGAFLRSDSNAFDDAMKRLTTRYGDEFLIQRAYREKIANWPRIGDKDGKSLQDFTDFLTACSDAIPLVKGLEVLNDCEENRKILSKLPDWMKRRWNRIVTSHLKDKGTFPSFSQFVEFLNDESDVANNPIFKNINDRSTSHEQNARNSKPIGKVFSSKSDLHSSTATKKFNDVPASLKKPYSCVVCSKDHKVEYCFKFQGMKVEERRDFAKNQRLCFGCLGVGHRIKYCRQRETCGKCEKRHPTLLHIDQVNLTESGTSRPITEPCEVNVSAVACHANKKCTLTSMIVPVWVSSAPFSSSEVLTYAMLDTQSDSSFISHSLKDSLNLSGDDVRLKLSTMSSSSVLVDCQAIHGLSVRGFNSDISMVVPKLYTKDVIPVDESSIPTPETARNWQHLQTVAHKMSPRQNCEVGLLIGYNCPQALTPREVVSGIDEQPFALRTDLGWSIIGGQTSATTFCHRICIKEVPITGRDVLSALERDFKFEKDMKVSQEDVQFMKMMEDGKQQLENGHIQLPLPFKSRPIMPNNKLLAEKRLGYLRKRFLKDQQFRSDYTVFMEDIIAKNDAEICTETKEGESWFLPHHGVYHQRKPGKIRVVFDCSSKYNGTSLNDHLLTGPDLTNNLTGVLCRFRKERVAFTCDVERMFHQFLVEPEDRGFLKFLWWPGGDVEHNPSVYRMRVHLFGAASSPGCANFGLKHLASIQKGELSAGSDFILNHFYVDDGLISTKTCEEAVKVAKEATELCRRGGLRLHKFSSNSIEFLSALSREDLAKELTEVDLYSDQLPMTSTLGIRWDMNNDTFLFNVQAITEDSKYSRRNILAMVASVYDPLGFLAPFILCGKIILQIMCRTGTSWDDPLPDVLLPRWKKWLSDFMEISKIRIPRCLYPMNFGEIKSVELHHFSDASTTGYGQCSYLKLIDLDDRVHCSFLIGKSRVAPTKITTIPRLELTAAVVSVKVSHTLKEELHISPDKEIFWTDSKVVLGYISNDARRFQMFVANRIQTIHEHSNPSQWHYVESSANPADHASRGLTAPELLESNWFSGPEFLWKSEIIYPSKYKYTLQRDDPEIKRTCIFQTSADESVNEESPLVPYFLKFSKWTLLVRAIARLRRRVKGTVSTSPATLDEIKETERFIIRVTQESENRDRGKLESLDSFIDHDGILRVGGRIQASSSPFELKHPFILNKNSHISRLLVIHHHERIHHLGRGITLNELRSNGIWIIGANSLVSSVVRSCVPCRKQRRPLENQKMADLPIERVEPSPPFLYCGMDCFGTFNTKVGRKENKRYGLLFTCLCSRAVHIEMLDDLSSDSFINALRSFIAIRGKVKKIISDRGTNFVGAQNELNIALNDTNVDKITSYLRDNQSCEFVFNVPHASHMGGVWERQIRTIRSVLWDVCDLQRGRLDDSSLRTLFYEAMSIINNRPLSLDYINSHEMQPITPNHVLTMKSSIPPPPGKFDQKDLYLKKRWRRVQYLLEQFWSRWRKEYLFNQNSRKIWRKEKRNLMVGDTVLLHEPNALRNEWPMGIVDEVLPSSDGLVRKVKVRVYRQNKQSILERPIHKLVLLVECV